MSNTKTMRAGSAMHRALSALPARAAMTTGAVATALGMRSSAEIKRVHGYLQSHAARGNVTKTVEGGWCYWKRTARGQRQLRNAQ